MVRDARGIPIHHVSMSWSLYAHHSVVSVRKADPRGDGRPPRSLAAVRVSLGFLDLVGQPSLDAALTMSRALVLALARGDVDAKAQPPAPPEGATGAALIDPAQTALPGL